MSKKDFIAIANALAASKAPLRVCQAVAIACQDSSPRFDYRKFMVACGVDPREL